jgi:hypothetical protein
MRPLACVSFLVVFLSMSIPILFQPFELFFVDDIDLAKGKEAGSNGNQALCASPAGICLFPSLYYNVLSSGGRRHRGT